MERCAELIEKLKLDFNSNESIDSLLNIVQLIKNELLKKVEEGNIIENKKIAILMPNQFNSINTNDFVNTKVEPIIEAKENEDLSKNLIINDEKNNRIDSEALINNNSNEKLVFTLEVNEDLEKELIEDENKTELLNKESEILLKAKHIIPSNEINELNNNVELKENGKKTFELNDHLTEDTNELGLKFEETPIQDLRKGISLNDKFLFINELFRNDETMYDRSLKTINNFSSYSEAMLWIERELRSKIGWNIDSEIVQHFYSFVKRRFS